MTDDKYVRYISTNILCWESSKETTWTSESIKPSQGSHEKKDQSHKLAYHGECYVGNPNSIIYLIESNHRVVRVHKQNITKDQIDVNHQNWCYIMIHWLKQCKGSRMIKIELSLTLSSHRSGSAIICFYKILRRKILILWNVLEKLIRNMV